MTCIIYDTYVKRLSGCKFLLYLQMSSKIQTITNLIMHNYTSYRENLYISYRMGEKSVHVGQKHFGTRGHFLGEEVIISQKLNKRFYHKFLAKC